MNRPIRLGTLAALSLSLALPPLPLLASGSPAAEPAAAPEPALVARGRGGGGRSGGGRSGGGRSYGRSSGSRSSGSGRTGFASYSNGGSAYRGSSKPAGGFSNGSKPAASGTRQTQRSQNATTRQQGRQDQAGNRQGQRTDQRSGRQGERTDRTDIRQDNRTDRGTNRQDQRSDRVSDRTDVRGDRVDNRWDNTWSGWARPGWGYARPWNYGWYGGVSSWPWWRPGVGIAAVASAAIITDAVDDAISNQVTYIEVPDTSYELYYTSVEPVNNDAVTFAVDTGSGVVEMTADCRQGTLDGRVPQSQAEAQLLNAACEVAFGSG